MAAFCSHGISSDCAACHSIAGILREPIPRQTDVPSESRESFRFWSSVDPAHVIWHDKPESWHSRYKREYEAKLEAGR